MDRCLTGFVNAPYEVRDRLLEDGTLRLIEIETEDDEEEIVEIFKKSGWTLWTY